MKATYRGPGDAVELDGLRIEKGKSCELTIEQVMRIRASDPHALVDAEEGSETPLDVVRIQVAQDRMREEALVKRDEDEQAVINAREKAERDAAERATKLARAREKARADAEREQAELRAGGAKKGAS